MIREAPRPRDGYPTVCREPAPFLSAKRFHCRLRAWHEGEHVSCVGAWAGGDRGVHPRVKPTRKR